MRHHIIGILIDKKCVKHHFTADAIDDSQTTSQIFRPDEIHGLALDKNVCLSLRIIFSFIFISLRLILHNIVVVFAIHRHESVMDLHVFPIPIPPPTSLPIPFFWVFPVLQP